MPATPIATVLMPVYNGEEYLREAIDSILTQTYTDFEFLIINDGSTDSTEDIIKSYTDERIVYIKNETNLRLISTLNKGIGLARGKYIVRMDADDISQPNRLEVQIDFMEKNPSVGLCGSYIRTLGLGEKDYDIEYETTHDKIKFRLLFDTHFPHPAAIIRKQVLIDHGLLFEHKYIHCEDLAMWNKMAKVTQLAIIPQLLVLKREHAGQISSKYKSIQDTVTSDIRKELLSVFVPDIPADLMTAYDGFLRGQVPADTGLVVRLLDLFEKIIMGNRSSNTYDKTILENFFTLAYWNLCLASTQKGMVIYKKFNASISSSTNTVTPKSKMFFFLKALFHYHDKHFHLPVEID